MPHNKQPYSLLTTPTLPINLSRGRGRRKRLVRNPPPLILNRKRHASTLPLRRGYGLLELRLNLLLRKPPRLSPQHIGELLLRHSDLIAHGHEAVGEVQVVLLHQFESHHQVVDVVEDEGAAVAVGGFGLEEVHGLVAPVAARVEVVAGVVAVVETEAVALGFVRGGISTEFMVRDLRVRRLR